MNIELRDEILTKYNRLYEIYPIEKPLDGKMIASMVQEILNSFLKDKKNPAIYANGGHTRMLMADFMFAMKNVKIIIDNYSQENESGFMQISDEDICNYDIDGIIISSYKFRHEIKERLDKICPHIKVLDIYDEIHKLGVKLNADYYYGTHPHHVYRTINKIKNMEESEENLLELISIYVQIKDIDMAIESVKRLIVIAQSPIYRLLLEDLISLQELLHIGYESIGEKNVLLLCLDGMRRKDMIHKTMPKTMDVIDSKGVVYKNAYSYSTSTFESLIPVYSENLDLRTEKYDSRVVDIDDCRFIKEAIKQGRDIFFYTDMEKYIDGKNINYSGVFQTITEKIWAFVVDALGTDNGLFLIHELYETHYSFANPLTIGKAVFEGTAMLFDFLPAKGGKLRTDYIKQHADALRYVDGVLAKFLELSKYNIMLFADHGNLLLPENTTLSEVQEIHLSCSADWTEIPLVIMGENMTRGQNNDIVSLSELNNIIIALENNKIPVIKKCDYVKCGRTQIYNPDFRLLYKILNHEEDLMAFEAFIFGSGEKIIIFSNGLKKLYINEKQILDEDEIARIYSMIKCEVTVLG